MTTPAVKTLRQYIHAAAIQRRFMEPWRGDKVFVKQGGTILYAIDTNIVKLYTAPEATSLPSTARKEGYAQIFPDDDPKLSVALGHSLARFIFHHLTMKKHPLFIIPPIEEEIRRVYTAVTYEAKKEHEKAYKEFEQIKAKMQSLSKESDKSILLEKLIKEVPGLAQLTTGHHSPSSELRRFGNLMSEALIAPPEYVLKQGWIAEETVQRAIEPIEGVQSWMQIHGLREAWYDKICIAKPNNVINRLKLNDYTRAMAYLETSNIKIDKKDIVYLRNKINDVQVMARLEWINKQLDGDYRMVYITGDGSLNDAAKKHLLEGGKTSFSNLYIRHPRAFLAEHNVLSPGSKNTGEELFGNTEFLKWLDTFLGKTSTRIHAEDPDNLLNINDVELTKNIHSILDMHPNIINHFKKSWSSYTRNIVLYNIPEIMTGIEQDGFKEVAHDVELLIEKVETLLEKRVQETWNSFFEVATETGFGLLVYRQTQANKRSRNYPPLVFHTLPKTGKFVEKILSSNEDEVLNSKTYKKVIGDLLKEDPSGYAYNLAYGFLFAAWGNWHVSAILADRAIKIAKRGKNDLISGREASYLMAVALRHNVRKASDLAKIEPKLKEAEQNLNLDLSKRPNMNACGIRFELERRASNLTYQLFHLFFGENIPQEIPDLAFIQNNFQDLLNDLNEIDKQDNRMTMLVVERIIITNILMTALLRQFKLHESIDPTSLICHLDQLRENIDSKKIPTIKISFRVQAIYLTADLWISRDHKNKKKQREDVLSYLSDHNIKSSAVFPYDIKRFNFLREILSFV